MKLIKFEPKILKLIDLNTLSYSLSYNIQKYYENKLLSNENESSVLILVEHTPVYTIGFREKLDNNVYIKLKDSGADIIKSNRGGLTTFHGPGQIVAYPIINLRKTNPKLSLRKYVSLLEDTAIHTCRLLGVNAILNNESISHTGAWSNNKKICAIGVHCKRYVTTHGIALNNTVDLSWFQNIVPCGIVDKGVTSLKDELNYSIPMDLVKSTLVNVFQHLFKYSVEYDEDATKKLLKEFNQ